MCLYCNGEEKVSDIQFYVRYTISYHTISGRRGPDLPRTTLRPLRLPMRTPGVGGALLLQLLLAVRVRVVCARKEGD